MKLFLDQGVPQRAATLLREGGRDAVHASEVELSSAADAVILDWCRNNGAVVVTLDADFHTQVALSRATSPSIVRLRLQGLKGPATARLILEIVDAHQEALAAGALVTVQPGRLRLHRLPITRKDP